MIEVLMFSMPFALAIVLGFLAPFGIYVIYQVGTRFAPTFKLNIILWAMAIGAIIPVMLSKRVLNLELELHQQLTMADLASGAMVGRLLTLSILGIGVAEAIRGWLLARKKLLPKPAVNILIAMMAYEFGMIVLGFTGATLPSFNYKYLYIPVTLIAIYYLANSQINIKQFALHIKLAMLVLMLGSLLAAVITPDLALLRPYKGVIPGLTFRLYGLTQHANTLGPVALMLLIVEFYFPSTFLLRLLILFSGAGTFLLAQSKTAWMAAIVVFGLVLIPQFFVHLRTKKYGFQTAVMIVIAMLILAIFAGAVALHFDLLNKLQENEELTSFTGRTIIWAKTISEFESNPFFGYGPEIWSPIYRLRAGVLGAGQAHNQFIQTLGEGGGLGFLLLITYITVLFAVSIKVFKQSRGLVLALFLTIFVRCISESPLRTASIIDWPTFSHFVLIIFAVYYSQVRYRELNQSVVLADQKHGRFQFNT